MKNQQKITQFVFLSEEGAHNAGERAAMWVKSRLKGIAIVSVGVAAVAVFGALACVVGFLREMGKRGAR